MQNSFRRLRTLLPVPSFLRSAFGFPSDLDTRISDLAAAPPRCALRLGLCPVLLHFLVVPSVSVAAADIDSPRAGALVEVRQDGSLLATSASILSNLGAALPLRCEFGLPASAPVGRGFAGDAPTVVTSQWEDAGIRYTQTVLVTSLASETPPTKVLMVQLTGENISRDYTNATAAFTLTVGEQDLNLEWRSGPVHAVNLPNQPLVAAIDIGAEGVHESSGRQLKFRGHMPPGTSGAMTIKLPLERLAGQDQWEQLHALEFDEEFRREQRRSRLETNPVSDVVLADR
jgi:hypothetical protein